jgi:hypothetical protein
MRIDQAQALGYEVIIHVDRVIDYTPCLRVLLMRVLTVTLVGFLMRVLRKNGLPYTGLCGSLVCKTILVVNPWCDGVFRCMIDLESGIALRPAAAALLAMASGNSHLLDHMISTLGGVRAPTDTTMVQAVVREVATISALWALQVCFSGWVC